MNELLKQAKELKNKKVFEMECPVHYGIIQHKKDYPNKHYLPEMFPMSSCRCNEIKKIKAKELLKEVEKGCGLIVGGFQKGNEICGTAYNFEEKFYCYECKPVKKLLEEIIG